MADKPVEHTFEFDVGFAVTIRGCPRREDAEHHALKALLRHLPPDGRLVVAGEPRLVEDTKGDTDRT
jgi:16S rRNA G1207 methylase RsmC